MQSGAKLVSIKHLSKAKALNKHYYTINKTNVAVFGEIEAGFRKAAANRLVVIHKNIPQRKDKNDRITCRIALNIYVTDYDNLQILSNLCENESCKETSSSFLKYLVLAIYFLANPIYNYLNK